MLVSHLTPPFVSLGVTQEVARRIAKASTAASMPLDETEYVTSFKPQMMEVTYAWCRGAKFIDVIKMTKVSCGQMRGQS